MYIVGLLGSEWKYITNGIEIYSAENDVRLYSAPPEDDPSDPWALPVHPQTKTAFRGRGENRITKLSLTDVEFRSLCKSQGINLIQPTSRTEQSLRLLKFLFIFGCIGIFIGSFFGFFASLVGLFLGGMASYWKCLDSEFEEKQLMDLFFKARAEFQRWENFVLEVNLDEEKERVQFEKTARANWIRFHSIQNMSSIDSLDGREFELAIKEIFERMGYTIRMTPATGDFGVDLIATKNNESLVIQAKRYVGLVGVKAIQEAASGAIYYKATKAAVITSSYFTKNAKELARKSGVRLVDRKALLAIWEKAIPQNTTPEFDLNEYKTNVRKILTTINPLSGRSKRT